MHNLVRTEDLVRATAYPETAWDVDMEIRWSVIEVELRRTQNPTEHGRGSPA